MENARIKRVFPLGHRSATYKWRLVAIRRGIRGPIHKKGMLFFFDKQRLLGGCLIIKNFSRNDERFSIYLALLEVEILGNIAVR